MIMQVWEYYSNVEVMCKDTLIELQNVILIGNVILYIYTAVISKYQIHPRMKIAMMNVNVHSTSI